MSQLAGKRGQSVDGSWNFRGTRKTFARRKNVLCAGHTKRKAPAKTGAFPSESAAGQKW
jgi:hypothetical protein